MAGREEGVCIFIRNSIDFKKRKDLNISKNDSETISIEIFNKIKNISLSSVCRPPDFCLKEFKSSLKPIFENIHRKNKDLHLAGDFYINVLDYENNVKVKHLILRFETA